MNARHCIVDNLEAAKKTVILFRGEVRRNRVIEAKTPAVDKNVRIVDGSPARGRLPEILKRTAMIPG